MGALPQIKFKEPVSPAAEQILQDAQKLEAIGRLVAGVAHDFNNLITGIVLCSELLLIGMEKGDRLRRYAEEIRSAGAQGAALIQQLLAVARQRDSEPRLLCVNDTVNGMRILLTRLIGENIDLITELADDLALVKIDPAQVQQIVLNLVLNARDAMPDGGRITLRTRNVVSGSPRNAVPVGQSAVELMVRDAGSGMDRKTRSHLFEPFFTTKEPGSGTGLGLSTVYHIVKHAGGQIEVDSEPGKGTQFSIRLPCAESQNGHVFQNQTSGRVVPGRKHKGASRKR